MILFYQFDRYKPRATRYNKVFGMANIPTDRRWRILSPIVMTYFLAGRPDVGLIDAHMTKTRPEYAD